MDTPIIDLSQQVGQAKYFSFSQQEEDSRVPVNIVFGGLEHCNRDYLINRKSFPVYLLEFVEDGSGSIELEGREEALRKGILYLYGPDIPCRIMNIGERPLVKYFFAFHCHGKPLEKVYGLGRLFYGSDRGGELVADLVRMLFAEGCAATEDSWKICCNYLDVILMKCARSGLMEQRHHERAWKVFKEVREFIEDNYLELHRMEDISRAIQLDASYISRLFKRYFHMTPYNFLLKKKMEHAMDLLHNGGMSVREVAFAIGFEDPFHFSRVFRKFKGISPSQMRIPVVSRLNRS